MRREALALAVSMTVLASGCSKLERLSIVRPSAERREFTRISPTYDVSGRKAESRALDANGLVRTAVDRFSRGQFDEAERLARQALKADPRSGDANTLLGSIADARGDAASAGSFYEAAVAIAPRSGIYANNYGSWLCANGRAAESLSWFDRALRDPAYPTPVAASANAGSCAMRAGMGARAETSWRVTLEADPVNLVALAGMARLEHARQQYFDARAFAQRWLAVTPQDAEGLRLAADIENKLGDNAAASRYLLRLQAISPGPDTTPRTQ